MDENTQAVIATQTTEQRGGTKNMELVDWIAAQGFSMDALDERQRASMESLHQRVQEAPAAIVNAGDDAHAFDKLRAEIAAETARTIKIRRACAGRHDELEAKAIAEGWDASRVELEVLRATRPAAPTIQATDLTKHGRALEAAICFSAGIAESELAKRYDADTLDAAQGRDLRGAGIHSLIYEVIQASGGHVRLGRVDNDTIRAALVADRQLNASAGFSTISLSGILSNVANKAMLAAYEAVASVASRFCAETDVNDFKQVTRYRLTGAGVFEKVGPDGELKHATLSENNYAQRARIHRRGFGTAAIGTREDGCQSAGIVRRQFAGPNTGCGSSGRPELRNCQNAPTSRRAIGTAQGCATERLAAAKLIVVESLRRIAVRLVPLAATGCC